MLGFGTSSSTFTFKPLRPQLRLSRGLPGGEFTPHYTTGRYAFGEGSTLPVQRTADACLFCVIRAGRGRPPVHC